MPRSKTLKRKKSNKSPKNKDLDMFERSEEKDEDLLKINF